MFTNEKMLFDQITLNDGNIFNDKIATESEVSLNVNLIFN